MKRTVVCVWLLLPLIVCNFGQCYEDPAETVGSKDSRLVTSSADVRAKLLERAREAAAAFTTAIPNFTCRQETTRYRGDLSFWPGRRVWKQLDKVVATIVVVNDSESYLDVSVNGNPAEGRHEVLNGLVSEGEFRSMLASLFDESRHARFTFRKKEVRSGVATAVYDYSVDRQDSNWEVKAGFSFTKPAYRGTVWIDIESARVVRIEARATEFPPRFPLGEARITLEYGVVQMAGKSYLLPVETENVMCARGNGRCLRNASAFRGYQRFASQSKITFDDK